MEEFVMECKEQGQGDAKDAGQDENLRKIHTSHNASGETGDKEEPEGNFEEEKDSSLIHIPSVRVPTEENINAAEQSPLEKHKDTNEVSTEHAHEQRDNQKEDGINIMELPNSQKEITFVSDDSKESRGDFSKVEFIQYLQLTHRRHIKQETVNDEMEVEPKCPKMSEESILVDTEEKAQNKLLENEPQFFHKSSITLERSEIKSIERDQNGPMNIVESNSKCNQSIRDQAEFNLMAVDSENNGSILVQPESCPTRKTKSERQDVSFAAALADYFEYTVSLTPKGDERAKLSGNSNEEDLIVQREPEEEGSETLGAKIRNSLEVSRSKEIGQKSVKSEEAETCMELFGDIPALNTLPEIQAEMPNDSVNDGKVSQVRSCNNIEKETKMQGNLVTGIEKDQGNQCIGSEIKQQVGIILGQTLTESGFELTFMEPSELLDAGYENSERDLNNESESSESESDEESSDQSELTGSDPIPKDPACPPIDEKSGSGSKVECPKPRVTELIEAKDYAKQDVSNMVELSSEIQAILNLVVQKVMSDISEEGNAKLEDNKPENVNICRSSNSEQKAEPGLDKDQGIKKATGEKSFGDSSSVDTLNRELEKNQIEIREETIGVEKCAEATSRSSQGYDIPYSPGQLVNTDTSPLDQTSGNSQTELPSPMDVQNSEDDSNDMGNKVVIKVEGKDVDLMREETDFLNMEYTEVSQIEGKETEGKERIIEEKEVETDENEIEIKDKEEEIEEDVFCEKEVEINQQKERIEKKEEGIEEKEQIGGKEVQIAEKQVFTFSQSDMFDVDPDSEGDDNDDGENRLVIDEDRTLGCSIEILNRSSPLFKMAEDIPEGKETGEKDVQTTEKLITSFSQGDMFDQQSQENLSDDRLVIDEDRAVRLSPEILTTDRQESPILFQDSQDVNKANCEQQSENGKEIQILTTADEKNSLIQNEPEITRHKELFPESKEKYDIVTYVLEVPKLEGTFVDTLNKGPIIQEAIGGQRSGSRSDEVIQRSDDVKRNQRSREVMGRSRSQEVIQRSEKVMRGQRSQEVILRSQGVLQTDIDDLLEEISQKLDLTLEHLSPTPNTTTTITAPFLPTATTTSTDSLPAEVRGVTVDPLRSDFVKATLVLSQSQSSLLSPPRDRAGGDGRGDGNDLLGGARAGGTEPTEGGVGGGGDGRIIKTSDSVDTMQNPQDKRSGGEERQSKGSTSWMAYTGEMHSGKQRETSQKNEDPQDNFLKGVETEKQDLSQNDEKGYLGDGGGDGQTGKITERFEDFPQGHSQGGGDVGSYDNSTESSPQKTPLKRPSVSEDDMVVPTKVPRPDLRRDTQEKDMGQFIAEDVGKTETEMQDPNGFYSQQYQDEFQPIEKASELDETCVQKVPEEAGLVPEGRGHPVKGAGPVSMRHGHVVEGAGPDQAVPDNSEGGKRPERPQRHLVDNDAISFYDDKSPADHSDAQGGMTCQGLGEFPKRPPDDATSHSSGKRAGSPVRPSSTFRWRYAPSVDFDSASVLDDTNTNEDQPHEPFHPLPLVTCHRPLRVGLSRRHRSRPLHPNYKLPSHFQQ